MNTAYAVVQHTKATPYAAKLSCGYREMIRTLWLAMEREFQDIYAMWLKFELPVALPVPVLIIVPEDCSTGVNFFQAVCAVVASWCRGYQVLNLRDPRESHVVLNPW
jgi:hypothetical protein